MIEMKPLISSNLAAAGYDLETKVLDIEFNNGTRYSYDEVPAETATGIFTASSPGQYFRNFIKGRYRFYKA
jgi:hypothetical protein